MRAVCVCVCVCVCVVQCVFLSVGLFSEYLIPPIITLFRGHIKGSGCFCLLACSFTFYYRDVVQV